MLYLLTNIGAWSGIALMLGIGTWLDRKNLQRISILTITTISLLISLSVILTNFVGYTIPITGGIKLALGNFLIFVIGMLFGPFFGVLGGIASDTLGTFVHIQGMYHGGFAFNVAFYGFAGSLVFIFYAERWWYIKAIVLYLIAFSCISFVFNVLWLYSIGWNNVILGITFLMKLIKFPIQMLIYLPMVLISFGVLYKLISTRHNISLWCSKKGEIIFPTFRTNKKEQHNH